MDFVFPVETGSQKAFIGLAVVFTLIATVSVGLRLLARRINQRSLGLDDYLVLSSWVLLIGYQGINISGAERTFWFLEGFGHEADVNWVGNSRCIRWNGLPCQGY